MKFGTLTHSDRKKLLQMKNWNGIDNQERYIAEMEEEMKALDGLSQIDKAEHLVNGCRHLECHALLTQKLNKEQLRRTEPTQIYVKIKQELLAIRSSQELRAVNFLDTAQPLGSANQLLQEEINKLRLELSKVRAEMENKNHQQKKTMEAAEENRNNEENPANIYNINVIQKPDDWRQNRSYNNQQGRNGRYLGNARTPNKFCHFCKVPGHTLDECWSLKKTTTICQKCHQPGHNARECHAIICFRCNRPGHKEADCNERKRKREDEDRREEQRKVRFDDDVRGNKNNRFYAREPEPEQNETEFTCWK